MSKKTLFIHSLFRTGSTYIWNKFRRDGRFYCYYEPFHQDIAKLNLSNPSPWSCDRMTTQAMGHPDLDKDYMFEYRSLLEPEVSGVPLFKKSFSFDDFCRNDDHPDQKAYVDSLIANTGERIPVLQFNRSALRIRWFKHQYPKDPHIYLLRNPEDQFHSYDELSRNNNLDIFFVMDLLTASVNVSSSPLFKRICERVHLFEFHSDSIDDEIRFYRKMLPLYSLRERYFIFYYIWFASLLENVLYADRLISMEHLSENGEYKQEVSQWLASLGIESMEFCDAHIRRRDKKLWKTDDMKDVRETAEALILRQYPPDDLKKVLSRINKWEREYLEFDLSHWLKEAQKPLQSVPFYHIRLRKYMLIIEHFFQSIMDNGAKGPDATANNQRSSAWRSPQSNTDLFSLENTGALADVFPFQVDEELLQSQLVHVSRLMNHPNPESGDEAKGLQKIAVLLAQERNNFLLMDELMTQSIYAYNRRTRELEEKTEEYNNTVQELELRNRIITELEKEKASLNGQLQRILNSRGYRLLCFLRKPFNLFLKPQSDELTNIIDAPDASDNPVSPQKPTATETTLESGKPLTKENTWLCRDNQYSTTRRLFSGEKTSAIPPDIVKKSNSWGGLRSNGYFKKSAPGLPLVTVITVVLNDPNGLKKTIASVLEQTYTNVEYIIIDGGSDLPTRQLIESHNEQIDCWVSEADKGIYDAMNKGVRLSSGDWVIFINAGDYFFEKETIEKIFNSQYNDADFIYGHTFFLGGDFYGVVKAWSFDILWKTMVFTHQSLFTRTEILRNNPFDTRFKICADYNLIFNSYMKGLKFFNSDTVIASFDPGVSEVSRSRMAYEKWKVVRRHRNDFPFHWFYVKLFINRFFKDAKKKREKKNGEAKL